MPPKPTTLSAYQKDEVETLAAVLNAVQIADYFGIARRTFYDIMARDPEVAARYKKGKAKAIGTIAQGLINKARAGDTVSMIFYLKTQAGWREHRDPDEQLPGEEEQTWDFSNMSTEMLRLIRAAANGPKIGEHRDQEGKDSDPDVLRVAHDG